MKILMWRFSITPFRTSGEPQCFCNLRYYRFVSFSKQNIYHSIISPSDWNNTLWNVHRWIIVSDAQVISTENKIRLIVQKMEYQLHSTQSFGSDLSVLYCPGWEHLASTEKMSLVGQSKVSWWMHLLSLRSDWKVRPLSRELVLRHSGCLPADDKPLSVSICWLQ